MNNSQYTIRSIPPKVDAALRQQARKTGKSLNEVAIDALAKGAGVAPGATFKDMDWFIGGKSLDKSLCDAVEWLDSVPQDIK